MAAYAKIAGNPALAKLHAAALKAHNRTSAISVGDFYGYAKSLLPEIRKSVDTKGNKDGKLQSAEMKHLSPEAKLLVRMHHPAR